MSRFACLFILYLAAGATLNGQQASEEPTYRVDAEVTVTGTVAKVFTHTGQRGTPRSRATITAADGTAVDLHLGPSSFVMERQMALAVGDRVTVNRVAGGDRDGDCPAPGACGRDARPAECRGTAALGGPPPLR